MAKDARIMKVLVETSPLYTSRAGVARYVRGLLRGFRAVAPSDVRIEELGWPVENFGYAQPARALKTLVREWVWARLIAPRRARLADVLHHTSIPIIPYVRPARHVATMYDLAVLRHPERYRPWQRWTGAMRLQRLASADRVICISRFTADEARRLLSLDAGRLEVIHCGGWGEGAPTRAPDAFTPPPEFLLFVGSLEPGKNLALLKEIYERAVSVNRPLPPLVIVGARWRGVASEGSPPSGWVYAGHQPDTVLGWLYQRARALVFPSRYEGFGLPVVEAMSLGCPVICGRVASLPEVAGDAAQYAELEPAAFASAVRRVLEDDALADDLRAQGRRQATLFSWERCARETLAVYNAVTRL